MDYNKELNKYKKYLINNYDNLLIKYLDGIISGKTELDSKTINWLIDNSLKATYYNNQRLLFALNPEKMFIKPTKKELEEEMASSIYW